MELIIKPLEDETKMDSISKVNPAEEKALELMVGRIVSQAIEGIIGTNAKNKKDFLDIVVGITDSFGKFDDEGFAEQLDYVGDIILDFLRVVGVSESAIADLMNDDGEVSKAELIALSEMLADEVQDSVMLYVAKVMEQSGVQLDSVGDDYVSANAKPFEYYLDAIDFSVYQEEYDDNSDDDVGVEMDSVDKSEVCECKGGEKPCECKGCSSEENDDKTELDDIAYPSEAQCKSGREGGGRRVPKGPHQICTQGAKFGSAKPVWWRRIRPGRKGKNKPSPAEAKVLDKMHMANRSERAKARRAKTMAKRVKMFKKKG